MIRRSTRKRKKKKVKWREKKKVGSKEHRVSWSKREAQEEERTKKRGEQVQV